jgi:WD40 repeat protein
MGYASFEVSVAYSPDGRTVAAGHIELARGTPSSPDSTMVSLCDIPSLKERITIEGPPSDACHVAFSSDGSILAVSRGAAVTLYDAQTGTQQAVLATGDIGDPLSVAFSRAGRQLAAATSSGYIVVWDLDAKHAPAVITTYSDSALAIAVSPDGKTVATASNGPTRCRRLGPLGLPPRLFGTVGYACGPDGGIVRLFDVASGRELTALKHKWVAYSVAFSPDGKLLASAGGGVAMLWDPAASTTRVVTTAEPDRDVYSVAFSPDGETLAVGLGSPDFHGSYGEVRLCEVASGRVRALLQSKQAGKIRSLAFAPDGKMLATGSQQAVLLWDVPAIPAQSMNRNSGQAGRTAVVVGTSGTQTQ